MSQNLNKQILKDMSGFNHRLMNLRRREKQPLSGQKGRKSLRNDPNGRMSQTSTRDTKFCWMWMRTPTSMLLKVCFSLVCF